MRCLVESIAPSSLLHLSIPECWEDGVVLLDAQKTPIASRDALLPKTAELRPLSQQQGPQPGQRPSPCPSAAKGRGGGELRPKAPR